MTWHFALSLLWLSVAQQLLSGTFASWLWYTFGESCNWSICSWWMPALDSLWTELNVTLAHLYIQRLAIPNVAVGAFQVEDKWGGANCSFPTCIQTPSHHSHILPNALKSYFFWNITPRSLDHLPYCLGLLRAITQHYVGSHISKPVL